MSEYQYPPLSVPMAYLTDPTMASQNILGEYQLLHLKRATEIERQMRDLLRMYIAEMSAAGFALFMRENREELLRMCSSLDTKEVVNLGDGQPSQLAANASAVDRGPGDPDVRG